MTALIMSYSTGNRLINARLTFTPTQNYQTTQHSSMLEVGKVIIVGVRRLNEYDKRYVDVINSTVQ